MTEELPLCECGCGKPVAKKGNRFVYGHNRQGISLSDESKKKMSDSATKRWSDGETRKRQSNIVTKRFEDPEERERQSDLQTKRFEDPAERKKLSVAQRKRWVDHEPSEETRKRQSESMKNSEAAEINHRMQRGGNDIVNHHYIYDHSDLNKYTMEVTRAKHTQIHHWLRKAGIKVPHINV